MVMHKEHPMDDTTTRPIPARLWQDIPAAIAQLDAEGQAVSVRNVHAITGGSMTDVSAALRALRGNGPAGDEPPVTHVDTLNTERAHVEAEDAATTAAIAALEDRIRAGMLTKTAEDEVEAWQVERDGLRRKRERLQLQREALEGSRPTAERNDARQYSQQALREHSARTQAYQQALERFHALLPHLEDIEQAYAEMSTLGTQAADAGDRACVAAVLAGEAFPETTRCSVPAPPVLPDLHSRYAQALGRVRAQDDTLIGRLAALPLSDAQRQVLEAFEAERAQIARALDTATQHQALHGRCVEALEHWCAGKPFDRSLGLHLPPQAATEPMLASARRQHLGAYRDATQALERLSEQLDASRDALRRRWNALKRSDANALDDEDGAKVE